MSRLILPITFKAPAKSTDGTMHIGEFYPTINHIYDFIPKKKGAFKRIKEPAKYYLQEVEWLAKQWAQKTGWKMPGQQQKVIVRIWYYFKDNKRPDTHNLPKVLIDQLQQIIFPNDKWILVQEMDYQIDKENPRLELSFEVVE